MIHVLETPNPKYKVSKFTLERKLRSKISFIPRSRIPPAFWASSGLRIVSTKLPLSLPSPGPLIRPAWNLDFGKHPTMLPTTGVAKHVFVLLNFPAAILLNTMQTCEVRSRSREATASRETALLNFPAAILLYKDHTHKTESWILHTTCRRIVVWKDFKAKTVSTLESWFRRYLMRKPFRLWNLDVGRFVNANCFDFGILILKASKTKTVFDLGIMVFTNFECKNRFDFGIVILKCLKTNTVSILESWFWKIKERKPFRFWNPDLNNF